MHSIDVHSLRGESLRLLVVNIDYSSLPSTTWPSRIFQSSFFCKFW